MRAGGRRISAWFGMNLCSTTVLSGSTLTAADLHTPLTGYPRRAAQARTPRFRGDVGGDPSRCSGQMTTKPCEARSAHTPE
jgi:hypothetical protein